MKTFKSFTMPLLLSIFLAVGLSSCENDRYYEEPVRYWYLSGVWQAMQYPDEYMTFYPDGTGYWENYYTGEMEDFDYYCWDDGIFFTWYPYHGRPYGENCRILMVNPNALQITYPGGEGYGPQTIYYSRVE